MARSPLEIHRWRLNVLFDFPVASKMGKKRKKEKKKEGGEREKSLVGGESSMKRAAAKKSAGRISRGPFITGRIIHLSQLEISICIRGLSGVRRCQRPRRRRRRRRRGRLQTEPVSRTSASSRNESLGN